MKIKDKLAAIGLFSGLLLACGSANDTAIDRLGIFGALLLCMAFLAVSMLSAARLSTWVKKEEETKHEQGTSSTMHDADAGMREPVCADYDR